MCFNVYTRFGGTDTAGAVLEQESGDEYEAMECFENKFETKKAMDSMMA
jgi:hypothetical protein